MSKCHMADRRINGIAMYVCMYVCVNVVMCMNELMLQITLNRGTVQNTRNI